MNKIKIEATLDMPVKMAWDCYTKPEHITKWNFASDDWHCPRAKNDLKVGGVCEARMEAKDGSFGFDFQGIYTEIENQKKLSYALDDGRVVTTAFQALGGKTKVTTEFDPETQNPEEMQRQGWQAILDNFKKYAQATK